MLNVVERNQYLLVFIFVLLFLETNTKFIQKTEEACPLCASGNENVILYNDAKQLADNAMLRRSKRGLDNFLIAPNTRWCGKGTTADEYNNLGGASAADKCCRAHDHCKYYIPAMGTRYDFFNYHLYTLSHCQCDRRFRTCLKMANNEDANAIGQLFFNVAQMRCFVLRTEKICKLRNEDGTCKREEEKQKAYIRDIERY